VKRRLAAGLAFTLASSGLAAGADEQETKERDFPGLAREAEKANVLDRAEMRFNVNSSFVPGGDFGSFSADLYRPAARFKITLPVARSAVARLAASTHADVYDFEGISDLFETGPTRGDPFEELHAVTVRLQGAYLLEDCCTLFSDREHWALLGEGFWRGRWEAGSEISDGHNGGATLALGYLLPGSLELALGIQISSKLLESGVSVSPVFDLDWKINDRWRLGNYGAGLRVEYRPRRGLVLFAQSRLKSRSYRLDDRGGTIGKASVRSREIPVGIGVRWDALDVLRVTVTAGVMAYYELRIQDEDRNTLGRETADPAPYLELRFDLRPDERSAARGATRPGRGPGGPPGSRPGHGSLRK
jgi:hypothetical protein